jgi:hypothetical protein
MRGIAVLALSFLALLLLALAGVAVAAGARAAGTTTHTTLTITYWASGQDGGDRVVWTLRCDPARGTHPRPALSCRRLATGGWRLFAPLRKDVVCTEIYGGPQEARIVGMVDGRRVWATLSRRNGCEIARWSRVSPWLLPPGGVT